MTQPRSAVVGPTPTLQSRVSASRPAAHHVVLHGTGSVALPWSSVSCALLLCACATRGFCRPWGNVARTARRQQVVQCRAMVEMGTVPHLVPSAAAQPLPTDPPVTEAHVLTSPPCLMSPCPQDGSLPAVPLPKHVPHHAVMQEQPTAPAPTLPPAMVVKSLTEAVPPASPTSCSRPARLAAGARRAEARRASNRPGRQRQTRTARRSIGARLQTAPEYPPVTEQSYDPSRLRTKIQLALRTKTPACSSRSREPETPAACVPLTEKSSGLGSTCCDMSLKLPTRTSSLNIETWRRA